MKFRKLTFVWLGALTLAMFLFSTTSANNQEPPAASTLHEQEVLGTFVVTSTADSGDNNTAANGTLRRALLNANSTPGKDLIRFDLPGSGVKTIVIVKWFPSITDDAGVIIDGTLSNDRIEIDARNTRGHYTFHVTSNNNIFKGLTINGNPDAAAFGLETANGNVFVGNLIGTNTAGTAAKPNRAGILLNNSHNNRIGGTVGVSPGGACTGECNLLSGSELHGIVLDNHSSNNRIIGNYIGVNKAGTASITNHEDGILIANSHQNTVGGAAPAERNVISGNGVAGIEIGLVGSYGNLVKGNYFGTNSAGNGLVTVDGVGVLVDLEAHDNVIDGNVISGHQSGGVLVFRDAVRTEIKNNRIGISPSNDSNLGNNGKGIEIQANGNYIHHNRIGNNDSDAIRIKTGMNNRISQNVSFNNRTFGINLGTDAFSPNDPGDGDQGPNGLQNFPTINVARAGGNGLTIQGSLNSRPNARYTLEFFQNPACDLTFNHAVGEGKVYLGTTQVTTNGSGNAGFNIVLANAPTSGVVTGTATDSQNNTSEFSYCRAITSAGPPPTQPQLLAPTNNQNLTQNPPLLDWSASAHVETYKVVVREGARKGPKVVKQKVTGHQFTPQALAKGKTYYWRVTACNATDCVKSEFFSFHIP